MKKLFILPLLSCTLLGCDVEEEKKEPNKEDPTKHCSYNNTYYLKRISTSIDHTFTNNECNNLYRFSSYSKYYHMQASEFITEDGRYYVDPHYDYKDVKFTSTDGRTKKHYDGHAGDPFVYVTVTYYDENKVEIGGNAYSLQKGDEEFEFIYPMLFDYDSQIHEAMKYAKQVPIPMS